ncbi:MAG: flagellar protein export ATPase FliI [Hyphomicrobiales bacterium]|nr:flagellar protein export ATPase FliI [Rickettsiales bacterium]MCP5361990.1 flagellar protein export ATPase FliI [Hyphomicrobiales bacterium]
MQYEGFQDRVLHAQTEVNALKNARLSGQVCFVQGLLVGCEGLERFLSIGSQCQIHGRDGRRIHAEVVGFREDVALLMPFADLVGVGIGNRIELMETESVVRPDERWLGRVINAFGEPVDGKGPLPGGNIAYPLRNTPPLAHARNKVEGKIDLGVRALNTFVTCCSGQRMGIFAGSGVGKSILLSMITRFSRADVKVIGLIGERGRELQEFISDHLGEEGLKQAVVIVSTSDESALMRRQAAYVTLSVAEYFRDKGNNVLCLMDSVTRFAMAQREIGLSAGEPPTTKGYTPTVFVELPRLLERAGPGSRGKGSITGLFTVLVEGDDHNEPISDAVRGILDGHIVLDRLIAERGRYPAVNILRSVSRMMPGCNTSEQNELVTRARRLLSTYENMADVIRLGAYRKGSDPVIDQAIHYYDRLEQFLSQDIEESTSLEACYQSLAEILGSVESAAGAG